MSKSLFIIFPLIASIGIIPALSFADDAVFRAKGVVVGEDINGGIVWLDASGDEATTIVSWELGRVLTRYNVEPSSDCEQIYSICLSATATFTHNAAATKVGDQLMLKIDPDNNLFVIQPLTGVLADTDVVITAEFTKTYVNSWLSEPDDSPKSHTVELDESVGITAAP